MTPYQQSFEINVGMPSINVNFVGSNRQFTFLEVSLVYDKSDQHKTICDSYNLELAASKIKSLKIENGSSTYTLANEIKYDVLVAEDSCWLYAQFVAFVCRGCTIATLTNYANNKIYQDLTNADKYFSTDEKMYIDLRRSKGYTDELGSLTRDDSRLTLTVILKDAAATKMRFRVMGYSQCEYYYAVSLRGLIMQYKNYGIAKYKNRVA